MNQNLDSLSDWFRANKLSLNVTKNHDMLYTKSTPSNNVRYLAIGNENISKVACTKFLGMHIDDKLKSIKDATTAHIFREYKYVFIHRIFIFLGITDNITR